MTEETIERIADQEMDRFDYQLLNGIIDQATYDQEVRDLELWCREMYRRG
jgi:hypothetical protein